MKLTKPTFKATSKRPSPDMAMLLMAEARELLTTWEVLRDKKLIERHLKTMDKRYGEGSEQRVRFYMHQVAKDERCA